MAGGCGLRAGWNGLRIRGRALTWMLLIPWSAPPAKERNGQAVLMKAPKRFEGASLCAFLRADATGYFRFFQNRKYLPLPLVGASKFLIAIMNLEDAQFAAPPGCQKISLIFSDRSHGGVAIIVSFGSFASLCGRLSGSRRRFLCAARNKLGCGLRRLKGPVP